MAREEGEMHYKDDEVEIESQDQGKKQQQICQPQGLIELL